MEKIIRARQYGSTIIPRGVCSVCEDECLIVGNVSSCCRAEVRAFTEGSISKETIMTAQQKRHKPPAHVRRFILDTQKNCCYWCGRAFGSWVAAKSGKVYELKPCWDHFIPCVLTSSSQSDQFVASCWVCNIYKRSQVPIEGEEDVLRTRILQGWKHAKWVDLGI